MSVTRSQVLVEQSIFNQSDDGGGNDKRGFNVWLPFGTRAGQWQFYVLRDHTDDTDGVLPCLDLQGHYICAVKGGSYLGVDADGGAINKGSYAASTCDGWQFFHSNAGADRALVLTVPTGTLRLFVLGYPVNGSGKCDVTASGSPTLHYSELDFDDQGDFGTSASIDNWVKLASWSGGSEASETVTLTTQTTASCRIIGFLAITSETADDPDDGVYDPETLVAVSGFGTTRSPATCPVRFTWGGAGDDFWWGNGHWDADNTLTGESQALSTGWTGVAPTATADQRCTTAASSFIRRLAGTVTADDGSSRDVGTWEEVFTFTPAGLHIRQRFTFNATAESQGLAFSNDSGIKGGYACRWDLPGQFTSARRVPADATRTALTPWPTGSHEGHCVGSAGTWLCYSPVAVAMMTGGSMLYDASAGEYLSGSHGFIQARTDGLPVMYISVNNGLETALAEDDVLETWQYRQLVPPSPVHMGDGLSPLALPAY